MEEGGGRPVAAGGGSTVERGAVVVNTGVVCIGGTYEVPVMGK